jgi:type IV secretory pathway VirB2 component (pilin)
MSLENFRRRRRLTVIITGLLRGWGAPARGAGAQRALASAPQSQGGCVVVACALNMGPAARFIAVIVVVIAASSSTFGEVLQCIEVEYFEVIRLLVGNVSSEG